MWWYIILISIIILSIYVIFNLLHKLEYFEDIIKSNNLYINKIQEAIIFSENKLKEIDEKETFKSDDEIGWFFGNLKYIQEMISNCKII